MCDARQTPLARQNAAKKPCQVRALERILQHTSLTGCERTLIDWPAGSSASRGAWRVGSSPGRSHARDASQRRGEDGMVLPKRGCQSGGSLCAMLTTLHSHAKRSQEVTLSTSARENMAKASLAGR
jgi:hypothetical protein